MTGPLPNPIGDILLQPVIEVSVAISGFLQRCAQAIANRQLPPPLAELDAVFAGHAKAVTAMRHQGLSRHLPDDDLARIFGLGFALDQLHRDLGDLTERGTELADQAPGP